MDVHTVILALIFSFKSASSEEEHTKSNKEEITRLINEVNEGNINVYLDNSYDIEEEENVSHCFYMFSACLGGEV